MQAIGSNVASVAPTVYRASREYSQDAHVEGLPLGTRGGMLVEHLFPADGDYTFNLTNHAHATLYLDDKSVLDNGRYFYFYLERV